MGGGVSFPVVPLSRDRVVLVTGGNTGLGYEAAKHIAMMGASVVIACRSQTRATQAIQRMNEEFRASKEAGTLPEGISQTGSLAVDFMELDLASLKSTMAFIEAFKASGRKLHVLLCNAGVAMLPRGFTEDGHETMFQVNYLGHFLIIAHLVPTMKTSGSDCRIIFTSSQAHMYSEREFRESKVKAEDPAVYGRMLNYGTSKLFQIHHMFCLSRRLKGTDISVTCLHPGIVRTEVTRSFTDSTALAAMFGTFRMLGFTKTPLQGATTLIDAAVNTVWRGVSDVYLMDCKPSSTHSCARNQEYQEKVWKYSLECLKNYLPEDVVDSLEGRS
ncbi:retinol dehydrogenase 14-like isoform X3 [Haliotis rubra]|uniref:retinol dehydrogenase 14-like isoform X3 n=1 Tax=Haliotis rubra TaxID=36100 RepID=UPI001EE5B1D0|nr:retinol dehydrogenase 14-like isoform X3 [Haliotis rubra]